MTRLGYELTAAPEADRPALRVQLVRHHLGFASHPDTPPAEAIRQRGLARQQLQALAKDPKAPDRDEMLLSLALLHVNDQPLLMKDAVFELVREMPTSPFIAHAFVAFGDHMLAMGKPDNACMMYDKAAQFPLVEIRAYTEYRRAWCTMPRFAPDDADPALSLQDHDASSAPCPP